MFCSKYGLRETLNSNKIECDCLDYNWYMIYMIICKKNMTVTAKYYIDGLVQERRNSIANAQELRLSCTNSSLYCLEYHRDLV